MKEQEVENPWIREAAKLVEKQHRTCVSRALGVWEACYFPQCCNQIPHKKQFKGIGGYSGSQLEGHSPP